MSSAFVSDQLGAHRAVGIASFLALSYERGTRNLRIRVYFLGCEEWTLYGIAARLLSDYVDS